MVGSPGAGVVPAHVLRVLHPVSGITNGQKLVYVMSIIRYPDNHETDFCGFYWSENKGAYQGCRNHIGSR